MNKRFMPLMLAAPSLFAIATTAAAQEPTPPPTTPDTSTQSAAPSANADTANPSGSMTVVTRKPDLNEIGGYATATGNSIGGLNVNGAVNVPVIKDVLAVRAAGIFNDDEGTRVRSINNPTHPFVHQRGERVTVRFDPFDGLDIIGTYQHLLTKTH